MSRHFTNSVIALLVVFSALGWGLAYLNGKQAQEAIDRELEKPVCIAIPYPPEQRGAQCLVREPRA